MKIFLLFLLILSNTLLNAQQSESADFKIRTITAGVTLSNLSDTPTFKKGIEFLLKARDAYQPVLL